MTLRDIFIAAMRSGPNQRARRHNRQLGPIETGELFCIPEGDGDVNFFSMPRMVRLEQADWFSGFVREQKALLFALEPQPDGIEGYVALTSKSRAELLEQISDYGWASVVVHQVKNASASFTGSADDVDTVGMSMVVRMKSLK